MIAAHALPPPVLEQPAPRQVSYGLVTGKAARGTTRVLVLADGRRLVSKPLRRRRFSLRVTLPTGDVAVRVVTLAPGRRSSTRVVDVFGLPPSSRPRVVAAHQDPRLASRLDRLTRRYGGTSSAYVQSLTSGAGAAVNARATFPAASTLKLAIATTVLANYAGIPREGSSVRALLSAMIRNSDNAAANQLEILLGGSTSGGSHVINALMRSIGLENTEMYGGYELRTLSSRIPLRADRQPAYGFGKHTTASDLTRLLRAIWLASGGSGPLEAKGSGFTPADARFLLWLLAHVDDVPKLDRVERVNPGVVVMHKAGWVSDARHDAGLVFWSGGVFVAGVMTWDSRGVGGSADVLAGRVATAALQRLRALEGCPHRACKGHGRYPTRH